MKVLLVNGSPHKEGSTNEALLEVKASLEENGVEGEIFWLGTKAISGCIACGGCLETKRCVIDDKVNEFLDKAEDADGFVFGTPVHYAGTSGAISSFMDRVFYGKGAMFRGKVAASVASCRRAGSVCAFDRLNKYFTINEMPIVSSNYWNIVFGCNKEEAKEDKEGMQIMRILGKNMAWMIKCINLGRENGLPFPMGEEKIATNFIK